MYTYSFFNLCIELKLPACRPNFAEAARTKEKDDQAWFTATWREASILQRYWIQSDNKLSSRIEGSSR